MIPPVLKFCTSHEYMKIPAFHFAPFQIYMAEFQTLGAAKCPCLGRINHLPWSSRQSPDIEVLMAFM